MNLKKNLKLLSLNTGLLSFNIFGFSCITPARFIKERLKFIPGEIIKSNSDIVGLQEICTIKHQKYLIDSLKKNYPYVFFKKSAKFKFNNGLIIFSKYPISNGTFYPFNKNCFSEKNLINKGFLSCDIFINDFEKINFINTHLTAGGIFRRQFSKKVIEIRSLQIEQIVEVSLKNVLPTVIFGDFNAGPQIAVSNYDYIIKSGFVDSYLKKGLNDHTWDSTIYLNKTGTHSRSISQRIDHIFLQDTLLKRVKIESSKIIFTQPIFKLNNNEIHLSDHFGIQTELSLQ